MEFHTASSLILFVVKNGFVWKCCVPHCTQWFCWSLSLLDGYFIGNIPNIFRHAQMFPDLDPLAGPAMKPRGKWTSWLWSCGCWRMRTIGSGRSNCAWRRNWRSPPGHRAPAIWAMGGHGGPWGAMGYHGWPRGTKGLSSGLMLNGIGLHLEMTSFSFGVAAFFKCHRIFCRRPWVSMCCTWHTWNFSQNSYNSCFNEPLTKLDDLDGKSV